MVYIFDNIDLLNEDFFNRLKPLLSAQRLDKVERMRTAPAVRASITAYVLLRIALLEEYGINEAVIFTFGGNNKPYLKDYPHIFFSLSHSQNSVACVVAGNEAGIDIQKTKAVNKKLAKRVLTKDEYSKFLSADEPNDYFCEIWTVKESFLKKTGDGITKELRDIPAALVENLKTIKGTDYYCSVCGADAKVKYVGRDDFEKLL